MKNVDWLDQFAIVNRLPKKIIKELKSDGWIFKEKEFFMEKIHNGYHIDIEFCMGDFCVGIYSKKGKWLLEKKKSVQTFMEAYVATLLLEGRIDNGEHWKGEDD